MAAPHSLAERRRSRTFPRSQPCSSLLLHQRRRLRQRWSDQDTRGPGTQALSPPARLHETRPPVQVLYIYSSNNKTIQSQGSYRTPWALTRGSQASSRLSVDRGACSRVPTPTAAQGLGHGYRVGVPGVPGPCLHPRHERDQGPERWVSPLTLVQTYGGRVWTPRARCVGLAHALAMVTLTQQGPSVPHNGASEASGHTHSASTQPEI